VFHLGDLNAAHQHLAHALSMYDPSFHQPRVWETGIEPGVFCRCELSRTLLLRGCPDQALAQVTEAVAHARALEHPQPLAFALLFLALTQMGRREPRGVLETYEALETLCRKHSIAQELQWAGPLAGRARVELGDIDRGLQELEESLAAHTLTRSALLRPYYFGLYAGALMRGRRLEAAQHALEEGVRAMEDTSQRAYVAELHRLQADLHVARDQDADAEGCYREALRAAGVQGARWLELRAARGLANLLSRTRRPAEARAVLEPVVTGMTEGHDTLDYVYADGLLKNL
jgi:predicted ATPase